MNIARPQRAIIYCRVSSKKLVREGDGLRSQETGLLPVSRTPGLGVMVKPEVLHAASQVRA